MNQGRVFLRLNESYLLNSRKLGKQVIRDGPIEDIEVLLDTVLVSALWKDTVTHLKSPS